MIRSKKLLSVLRPLLDEMLVPDDVYGHIMKEYSPACRCSAKVKTLNYFELCKLAKNNSYNMTIVQNGKIFDTDMNNCFYGAYEHIRACYQISPFNKAIVIARNICKYNSFRVFCYEPYVFDEIINVPQISCFKYLFGYFNVYKSNGTLVENLDELKGETEVIAISKQPLEYNYAAESHEIHIILRWYEGYF